MKLCLSLLMTGLQVILSPWWCQAEEFVVEEANYAEVRPGAHLFWLLQYTTHADGYMNRPWIIWIQGGPGVPGTAYGNYLMFGPKDLDGQPRPATWLQSASIIYVDSPIDTGFSYVNNGTKMATNIHEIADDLVRFTKIFLQGHPEFEEMPLYIMGQSYGGKMGPVFAYYLNEAQQEHEIQCDLRAVVIGNGYVSSYDIEVGMVGMLYQMSWMDLSAYDTALSHRHEMAAAHQTNDSAKYKEASKRFWAVIPFVSIYNIIEDPQNTTSMYSPEFTERVIAKMNNEFREKFEIIPDDVAFLTFGQTSFDMKDLYNPAYDLIDDLLYESSVQVIVYSGQYDVICPTSGQEAWIKRLTWPGMQEYHQKQRVTLYAADSQETEMFVKATERFKFYWVLKSGHVVPRDVPEVSLRMLNRILDNVDV